MAHLTPPNNCPEAPNIVQSGKSKTILIRICQYKKVYLYGSSVIFHISAGRAFHSQVAIVCYYVLMWGHLKIKIMKKIDKSTISKNKYTEFLQLLSHLYEIFMCDVHIYEISTSCWYDVMLPWLHFIIEGFIQKQPFQRCYFGCTPRPGLHPQSHSRGQMLQSTYCHQLSQEHCHPRCAHSSVFLI